MTTTTTDPTTETVRDTYESLREGDVIEVPQYANEMTVTLVGEILVGVRDARGNERELIQNKPNPENIYLVAGTTDKGRVTEITVVSRATDEDDDEDETDTDDDETNADDENEPETDDETGGFEFLTEDDLEDPEPGEVAEAEDDDADPHFDADAETVSASWIGSYIYTSWGYNQTNVEMAQIVDVSDTGKTVLARLVSPECVDTSRGSKSLRPSADQYGDEFRLHVRNSGGDPAFRGSYPYLNGNMDEGTRMDSFLPFSNTPEHSLHQTAPNCGH